MERMIDFLEAIKTYRLLKTVNNENTSITKIRERESHNSQLLNSLDLNIQIET